MLGDIIQPTHLLFILVIALLVLGPKRLPEVGRSLGRGIRDFREAISSHTADARELRDLVYSEDKLGGTATAGEHPVAESTPTSSSPGEVGRASVPEMAFARASHAPSPTPPAGPVTAEQPDAEPIYGD